MKTLKLMRLGDSITRGEHSPGSGGCWGYDLAPKDAQGWTAQAQWVGTQQFPDPSIASYLGPHEGYNGLSLEAALTMLPGLLAVNVPDVVFVMLGTNDMSPDPGVRAGAPARLSALLDAFGALTWVIVGTVPTILSPPQDPAAAGWVAAYNAALVDVVRAKRAAGRNVLLALTGEAIGANLYDGLHPNDVGYRLMAGAYARALDRLLAVIA